MKKEIIKTGNYLLVVDNSNINVNDWFYLDDANVIAKYIDADPVKEALKIIAYLPLNNAPILEGVPLLPPLDVEDDVEKLADKYANQFMDGKDNYNKGKQKYKFTEDDMRDAVCFGMLKGIKLGQETDSDWVNNYIKSKLKPKTPTHFEFEMKQKSLNGSIPVNQEWEFETKTTTNAQGQQVACGKYIYE